MADKKVTKYGVGRGRKIVGSLSENLEHVKQELLWYEGQMRSVGLEPDVKIMYVEEVTTTSTPKVWSPEPAAEPDAPVPAPDASDGKQVTSGSGTADAPPTS